MRLPDPPIRTIDYRQENAASSLLPKPSVLSSNGWNDLHLELFEQPKFEIAEHQHTMHVIAYAPSCTPRGERWLAGRRKRETRNEGAIAMIPANIPHRCNWNATAQFTILAIEPTLLQRMGRDWVNPDCIELIPRFMVEPDALIQSIFITLRDELVSGGIGSGLLVDSLKTALAIHLLRNYCATSPKSSCPSGGLSQAVQRLVTDYIREHLGRDMPLDELAKIAHISPYHFSRLFKQSLGISPHQYILRCRVEKAKSLLQRSDLSIAEIAIAVGFCDQSHLSRYFKRTFGATPHQFRQSRSQRDPLRGAQQGCGSSRSQEYPQSRATFF